MDVSFKSEDQEHADNLASAANQNYKEACVFVKWCRNHKYFNEGNIIGSWFSKKYRDIQNNRDCAEDLAFCQLYSGKKLEAFNTLESLLNYHKYIDKDTLNRILRLRSEASDDSVVYRNEKYNPSRVASIIQNIQAKRYIEGKEKGDDTSGMIAFTITTCKRFDLFSRTINSFLNSCTDLNFIDRWICVDDNSSEEDKIKMNEMYPFFEFYWKSPKEKGHAKSMNIIRHMTKNWSYIFHIEDDWTFYSIQPYITQCLHVLEEDYTLGQCIINPNYSEVATDVNIKGSSHHHTHNGFSYFLHHHMDTDSLYKNIGPCMNCVYWPHYSLRPGLIRTRVFSQIGIFNENAPHFEMEYAYRYEKEFKTSFLDRISSQHTGRLTTERGEKDNAYSLNNELQFGQKTVDTPLDSTSNEILSPHIASRINTSNLLYNRGFLTNGLIIGKWVKFNDGCGKIIDMDDFTFTISTSQGVKIFNKEEVMPFRKLTVLNPVNDFIKSYVSQKCTLNDNSFTFLYGTMNFRTRVVNMDRRTDRWDTFQKLPLNYINPERYRACDGNLVKYNHQLQRLFNGNDYNWRRGVIGCALSHINIWIQLFYEQNVDMYIVFEDDITLVPEFKQKLIYYLSSLGEDWEVAYLGHFFYKNKLSPDHHSEQLYPNSVKWSRIQSMNMSMGGTIGYVINKKGASNLLKYINEHGVSNGIDWVMMKASNTVNTYYPTTNLIHSKSPSDANQGVNIDSDIQYDYSNLAISQKEQMNIEISSLNTYLKSINFEHDIIQVTDNFNEILSIYGDTHVIAINTKVQKLKDEYQCGLNIINSDYGYPIGNWYIHFPPYLYDSDLFFEPLVFNNIYTLNGIEYELNKVQL
jgi:GR25 family glycosyltransferase involved in LPS biosynthesis